MSLYFKSFCIFIKNQHLVFEYDIVQSLEALKKGGLILYPTDTIWGIGCDATNPEAVKKIFVLKQRPESKSMIVLLADFRDINVYSGRPEPNIIEFLSKTTNPTTVIYENALGLAENLINEDGSIAMRIVREDFCRHLLKRFRKPIVSTSANISGQKAAENFAGISDDIKRGVDYIVKYRQQDNSKTRASVLVRFNKSGEPMILRP